MTTPPDAFCPSWGRILCCTALLLAGCASVAPPHAIRTDVADTPQAAPPPEGSARPRANRTPPREQTASTESPLPRITLPETPKPPRAIDLTGETDDLFERMRHGFAMPELNDELVLTHQQWYMNRPDYLRRVVDRSSRYLYHILDELEKRGMPTELALLPMVESAYNPMAYSRAKASGLWQFIPATGKRYNLGQNWWKDERRDILASTAAALDYLQSIYEMHGDWHLALASYNWGEGAVGRALEKNRARGLPTDYMSLTLPNETRNYVPKLQALKNIFRNPALVASLELPKIPNRPYFATVTTETHIDVKVAARLAGVPVQEFVALNPAHNRPVITPDSALVIPAEKLDTFVNNLEAHGDDGKPLSAWQTYTVRPGDKLEKIAQRFGMRASDLKSINGLKGKAPPAPGQQLLVSGSDKSPTAMAALPEQPKTTTEQKAAPRTHVAKRGETVTSIARRYGIPPAELRRLNKLNGERLSGGARLVLPSPAESTSATKSALPRASAADEKKSGTASRYTVRRGDTVYSIARQFKVTPQELARWNNLSGNALNPGQMLVIQTRKR